MMTDPVDHQVSRQSIWSRGQALDLTRREMAGFPYLGGILPRRRRLTDYPVPHVYRPPGGAVLCPPTAGLLLPDR